MAMRLLTPALLLFLLPTRGSPAALSPLPPPDTASFHFRIAVVDGATRRGVPLVLLRTGDFVQQYSDSAGNVAFFEPGLMDQPVWFSVLADGYNLSSRATDNPTAQAYSDGYDSGVVLTTTSGGSATVVLDRLQHAERVYRLTGGGIYRDSVLTGDHAAIPPSAVPRAVIDGASGSIGQDTLMLAPYKGQLIWLFGDTVCPRSARQNNCNGTGMYTVGARSCLPGGGPAAAANCDPAAPPALQYFGEESPPGFHHPHPIAPIPPLSQNTWIAALATIDAGTPQEALFGAYYKNPGDGAEPGSAAQGMARWDDESQTLIKHGEEWPRNASLSLNGVHAVQRLSPADAARLPKYVWFCNGAVNSRVLADAASMSSYSSFESLPRLGLGATEWHCQTVNWNVATGRYVCMGTAAVNSASDVQSIAFSHSLRGPYVNGSVSRNSFPSFATSSLPPPPLLSAPPSPRPSPMLLSSLVLTYAGWRLAVLQVVSTHNASGSSCYNALHMPHLDLSNGTIFYACTYTSMWSNNRTLGPNLWSTCLFGSRLGSGQGCAPVAPRYEYNNLVYRVDLMRLLGGDG